MESIPIKKLGDDIILLMSVLNGVSGREYAQ